MLVLSRLAKQTIKIGDDITVTIVSVDRGTVSVGIAAPRDVKVHRGEIYQDISSGIKRNKRMG